MSTTIFVAMGGRSARDAATPEVRQTRPVAGQPGQTSAQSSRRSVRVLFAASGPDLRGEVALLRDEVVPAVRRWGETRQLDVEVYGTWTLDEPSVEHPDQAAGAALDEPATAELRRLAEDPEVFLVAVLTRWSPGFDWLILGNLRDRTDSRSRGCVFTDQDTAVLTDLFHLAPAQIHRLPDTGADTGQIPGGELYRLVLDTLTDMIADAVERHPVEPDQGAPSSIPVTDGPDIDQAGIDAPVIDENVQFTVYRPRAVQVGAWYPMLAFAHLAERSPDAPPDQPDPADRVKAWATQILGADVKDYASPTSDARGAVPRESELTFVPEIDGIEFNPPRRTFQWLEDVHKEEFRLRAGPALTGQVARGRLTVFLGVLILADVDLAIRIDSSASTPTVEPVAGRVPNGNTEPGEVAMEPVHGNPYRKIFPSYSHLDVAIVEQAELLGRALGDVYTRDRTTLRSGEDWNARLLELIDDADIFQLFWSSNAMRSEYVRQEWEYALSRQRPFFIRPTYWEEPMPRSKEPELPPPTLSRLHFQSLRRDVLAERAASVPPGVLPPSSIDRAPSPPEQAVRPAPPRPSSGMDLICDACGASNPPGADFCWACNSFLAWDTPPAPGQPQPWPRPGTGAGDDVPAQARPTGPPPAFFPSTPPAAPPPAFIPSTPPTGPPPGFFPSTPPFAPPPAPRSSPSPVDRGSYSAPGSDGEFVLRRSVRSRRPLVVALVGLAIAAVIAILIWIVLSRS